MQFKLWNSSTSINQVTEIQWSQSELNSLYAQCNDKHSNVQRNDPSVTGVHCFTSVFIDFAF